MLLDKQVHRNGQASWGPEGLGVDRASVRKKRKQIASLHAAAALPASTASCPGAHMLKKAVERPQRE